MSGPAPAPNEGLVFGPVPSRRLGRSLGVDPIPLKTCNWNCVYCQLGRTSPLTNERKEWIPTEELLAALRDALAQVGEDGVDWISFVGSGEPTLHSGLGRMIREVKAMTSVPVAVITDGATLHLPDVREDLRAADAVLPTVSAGSRDIFLRLHRPMKELTFERFVEGLLAFRAEYHGKLWPEVMLVPGLNDTTGALEDTAALLSRLRPDAIHLVTATRPPTEAWVGAPAPGGVEEAVRVLERVAPVLAPEPHPESRLEPRRSALPVGKDAGEAVMALITRHPMTAAELAATFAELTPARAAAELDALVAAGRARALDRDGERYYGAAARR